MALSFSNPPILFYIYKISDHIDLTRNSQNSTETYENYTEVIIPLRCEAFQNSWYIKVAFPPKKNGNML